MVSLVGLGGHHIGRPKDENKGIAIVRAAVITGIDSYLGGTRRNREFRHADVEEDDRRSHPFGRFHRRESVERRLDLIAENFQHHRQAVRDVDIIVGDQDLERRFMQSIELASASVRDAWSVAGKRMVKVLPRPSPALSAPTGPPCMSSSCLK